MSILSKVGFKKSNNRNKIVLIGGAGWPNYGDELILDAWKRFLIEHEAADEIYFYEGTSKAAKKLHDHGGGDIKLFFRDDLERIAHSVKGLNFWEQVIRGYKFIKNNGFERYGDIDFSVFGKASSIHLHGGGYLNDFWPERGFFLGFAAAVNEKFSVKISATGIGLGPVKEVPDSKLEILKEIFSRYSIFELRDVEGFRNLRKYFNLTNIVYGLDDCFLRNTNDMFLARTGTRSLFLSFLENSVKKVSEEFWDELRNYSRGFDEVVFFESSPEQDNTVVEFVKNKIGNVRLQSVEESIKHPIFVNEDDEVICSRFHVHYIFSRYGLNGWYSSHNQDSRYYDVKHQSIVDRGSSFIFSDFSSLPLLDSDRVSYLSERDLSFHEEKCRIAKRIYSLD